MASSNMEWISEAKATLNSWIIFSNVIEMLFDWLKFKHLSNCLTDNVNYNTRYMNKAGR